MAVQQKKSEESPKSKEQKYESFLDKYLCHFRTAGRRCQILGGISNSTVGNLKEIWCSWHWLGLNHPESLQSFNEFQRYRKNDRETYPFCWEHASLYIEDEIAWQATLGKITHQEYIRYVRAKETELNKEKFKDVVVKSSNPVQKALKEKRK